jgi:CDGSH-type Zn-finger protein
MFRIRLRKSGPYVIDSDDVQIVDWNGAPYAIGRRPIALCRCGASSTKPFCDGTHKSRGFDAAEAADATQDAKLKAQN